MEWTGGIDRWVISYRHRILVFALLQCLLISNFCHAINAKSYHGNSAAELHRSMAKYRQLRAFDSSEDDLVLVDEAEMKEKEKEKGEVNLKELDQLQLGILEEDAEKESKRVDNLESHAEGKSNQSLLPGQQEQQGMLELEAGQAFKKADKLKSPHQGVSNSSSKLDNSNQTLHLDQQGMLELEAGQKSKKADKLKSPHQGLSNSSSELDNSNQTLHELESPLRVSNSSSELDNKNQTLHELKSPHQGLSNSSSELDNSNQTLHELESPLQGVSNSSSERDLKKDVGHNATIKERQKGDERKGLKEANTTEEDPFVFPEPYLLGPSIKDWDEQRGSWLEENPLMKSTADKPRVLIVTGSQPELCVSPVGDYYQLKSLKLKMDYARMHNYEIYYNLAWMDPLFGGWWVKLPTLRKLMLTHPEIEWFFWVDSDAVFTDMLFEAPFHTYEGFNMVMWGWEDGLYTNKSWVAFNAGVFLIRNCQWSLDLIDKWSPMGPKGPVRDEYGKMFTDFFSNRKSNFSSDDQSALAYLMITDEAVKSKVHLVESTSYTMSGFWIEVVETYENCAEKYHPGLGDKRWPWITHFTGCGFCAGGDNPDYAYERCTETFNRAYNFADNQVMAYMGFQHMNLSSEAVVPTRNETEHPIEFVGVNPWEERIAQVATAAE